VTTTDDESFGIWRAGVTTFEVH
jgi:hypothetical protein